MLVEGKKFNRLNLVTIESQIWHWGKILSYSYQYFSIAVDFIFLFIKIIRLSRSRALHSMTHIVLRKNHVMRVKQIRLKDFTAFSLESSFAVVRSGAAAPPVRPVLINGTAKVKYSLIHHLGVSTSNQLRA